MHLSFIELEALADSKYPQFQYSQTNPIDTAEVEICLMIMLLPKNS